MSMLWHYLRPGNSYPVGWVDIPVALAAIFVLVRPKNNYFLLAMAVAQIFVFLNSSPSSSNHWTMQFFVNVTLCASFICLAIRRRSVEISEDNWLEVLRPTVCLLVILLYLFASLHKLNSGYFSDYSFATRFYFDIVEGMRMRAGGFAALFPTDDSFLRILPYFSIVSELAIPILLFIRRGRLVAILIGVLFHLFLSLKEYPPGTDFPMLLGAAYILVPAESWNRPHQ